jgi:hypothetical protein
LALLSRLLHQQGLLVSPRQHGEDSSRVESVESDLTRLEKNNILLKNDKKKEKNLGCEVVFGGGCFLYKILPQGAVSLAPWQNLRGHGCVPGCDIIRWIVTGYVIKSGSADSVSDIFWSGDSDH